MHDLQKRPTDGELFGIWESLSSNKFEAYRVGALQRLAASIAFNVGSLAHSDPQIAEAAADNIALALCWAMQAPAQKSSVDRDYLLQSVATLLDAFGLDRQLIKLNMEQCCNAHVRQAVFYWVGNDFFAPP